MTRQFSLLDSLLEPPKPLTVSQLTGRIKSLLEGRFVDLWVEGEISNFKPHSSGHWYFTLKDRGASIRSACFRMTNRTIRFRIRDGMAVRVVGRLAVYEPRGDYQLIMDAIEPVGVGALQLAFEQLKAKLAKERLFDEARKRPIPALPRSVGVVTSPTGAALHDILRWAVVPAAVRAIFRVVPAIREVRERFRAARETGGRGGRGAQLIQTRRERFVERRIVLDVAAAVELVERRRGAGTIFAIRDA